MKKILLPILCLLIYTCDDDSSPTAPGGGSTDNCTEIIDSCGQCTEPSNSCDDLILGYWWYTQSASYDNDGSENGSSDTSDGSPTGMEQIVYHFKSDGTRDWYLSGILQGGSSSYTLISEPFGNWSSESQNGYLTRTFDAGTEWECTEIYEIINLDENSVTLRENNSNDCDCLNYPGSNDCDGYGISTYTRLVDFP